MKKAIKTLTLVLMVFAAAFCVFSALPSRSETASALTLKQGSTGGTVKTVQQKLKNWGYLKGAVDGIYGAKTTAAVKYFQRRNGLTVDGIAGSKTLAALGINTGSGQNNVTGNYSDSDVELLARLIYGEARGESYTGKVAVGAVILNRVASSSFPNTISGVIYQNGAFTCVSDGQINLGTNDECTRAAQDALNGWDPSGGALYYFNPATATSKWIWSRKQIVTIGKHIFCI